MYSAQQTADRIKAQAKQKKVLIKDLLEACELNKNTLSSMSSRGSWIQPNSLAKIADYLDCSVDYLLGKSDVPSRFYNEAELSPLDRQLISLLSQLTDEQKQSILRLILSLTGDEK